MGVTTNTYRVADAAGNVATCSFTVTVLDSELPEITCPGNLVVSNTPGLCGSSNVVYAVSASDNCGVVSTNRLTGLASGALFPVGVTTNTYRVADAAGNVATCSFTVTVLDSELPVITCPEEVIVFANSGCSATNVSLGTPVTSDNCTVANVTNNAWTSGSLPVVGPGFPITSVRLLGGVATVTWTSQSGRTYRLFYKDSLTAATWSQVSGDVAAVSGTTSQTNLVGGVTQRFYRVQLLTGAGLGGFAVGTNLVTWTVTDTSGNTRSCVQRVIVRDTSAPTLACPTNRVVSTDAGQCYATGVNLGSPLATNDNCGILTVTNNAPTQYAKGVTTVTWTAVDTSGNFQTCAQTVTVNDTELPTITCPTNRVVSTAVGQCFATAVNLGVPLATNDNCGILTVTNNAPTQYAKGVTIVTWTAVDTSGNFQRCVQTVTVNDTELPTLTCPTNRVVNTDAGQCFATGVNLGVPSATNDNCGILTVTNNAPTQYPRGVATVNWTAVDASGNFQTCVQTVTVTDNQTPLLTCPAAITTNVPSGWSGITNLALGTPVISDNCGGASTSNNAPAILPVGTNVVRWTVTDASGNASFCQQTVVVLGCAGLLNAPSLVGQSVCQGQSVVFQTIANSPDPITYVWRFNGQLLAGQTNNSLALPNVGLAAGGTYSVEVRTPCAAVTNSAPLNVLPTPSGSLISYTNSDGITIPMIGQASPYGSGIALQCVPGMAKNVTVSIFGFTHAFPYDVIVVLVSPDGRQVKLMAATGGAWALFDPVNLTFSEAASSSLPQFDPLTSGTYLPTDNHPDFEADMPFPANGPYFSGLSAFNGADPNGLWKLYVYDGGTSDAGSIASWSLNLEYQSKTLLLQKPTKLANGGFQIEVVGRTNLPTIMQRSSNLTTWLPLVTNVFSTNPGVFVDPAPLYPYRFYRAVQP